jgi:hypothetical protein
VEKLPKVIVRLAKMPHHLAGRVDVVEKVLGKSSAELEKAWIAWGSEPP